MQQPNFQQLLVDETPDALIAASPEGQMLYWNRSAETLFGYASEEMAGQSLFDLMMPAYRVEEVQSVQQKLSATPVLTYELLQRRKDGSLIYINASIRAVRDAQDQIAYLVANIKDVTRLKVQRDAKLLEERYRDLLEPTPDAIVIINNTGCIVLVNSQAERLFGYARLELLGQPIEVLLPERLHDVHRQHRAGYFAQPHTRSMGQGLALYGVQKDGAEFPVEVSLTPLVINGDTMVMSSIRSIAERHRIETARALLASIVESSDDAIISKTLSGIVTSWNGGAERMFGYSAAEMIGQAVTRLISPERLDEEAYILTRIQNGERIEHYETIRVHKEGHCLEVELTVSPLKDASQHIIGASKIARDITERKRLGHILREKEFLEQANRAKDQFLASMSHEFRTPLNAIIGFTGTLLMKLPGMLNAEQEKQLRTVQNSARHLLSLINDLLDLAKIESGEIQLTVEPVVCQSVLEEVARALRPAAEAKGLTFEVSVPANAVVVQTDRRALSQILINLANNAIKFTETGAVHLILMQTQEGKETVTEISVQDTGIGLKPEECKRVFQAFVQVGPGAKRRDEGTGLGLYLSQKLADLMGGRMTVQSRPGQGSRFTLVLGDK